MSLPGIKPEDVTRLTDIFMNTFKENLNPLATRRIAHIVTIDDSDKGFSFGKEIYQVVQANDHQNMSFLNLSHLNQVAVDMGKRAATAYNVLVGIAYQVYGATGFVSNYSTIKFCAVANDGPSVSDPSGEIAGWMAFRFKFVCGSTAQ